ncbi:MAG: macro domain-containing protein [Oscillospiraceae bacterium]|nr:macro domain-containing protein [Oscillospiraceae bacterium]
MKIVYIKCNIANVSANVIVLPSNEKLKEGSGTSQAIFSAAGRTELKEACNKIGFCKIGQSVYTPAFSLNADYIIHTVVPNKYHQGTNNTTFLYSSYCSAIQLADSLGCKSIVFPLLGSGCNGFNKEESLDLALSVIDDFDPVYLETVLICLFDELSCRMITDRGFSFSDPMADYRLPLYSMKTDNAAEYKPNININPNIYIRSNEYATHDIGYVKHITGHGLLKSLREKISPIVPVRLSALQEQIIKESETCCYVKNGQQTHGIAKNPDGTYLWSNRCEKSDCYLYEKCMASENARCIKRNDVISVDIQPEIEEIFNLEQLGITINNGSIDYSRKDTIEIQENNFSDYQIVSDAQPELKLTDGNEYECIGEPDAIIEASIDSHIILNSGPGTGKTYTIVQRLIYILSNQLCPADDIYILCYTRSAKKVIVDKINDAIAEGVIPVSAQNICILTFDSYATYFLMDIKDQIEEDFSKLDYNDRIRLFNKYITEEDFKPVGYFIIDEIQDLVNERAKMVLNIIRYLDCGFLLAGDRCQAIYDYEAENNATISSVEFYQQLEAMFPDDIERYELVGNRRQCSELASEAAKMRDVLLNYQDNRKQNKYANTMIEQYKESGNIEQYIKEMCSAPNESTAILCRSNGEAEYISSLLFRNKIPHDINRGVNNHRPLSKWIADVFWDFCGTEMLKNDFVERVQFRTSTEYDGEYLWSLICKLLQQENAMSVSMKKLIYALSLTNELPSEFFEKENKLVVSTIHKAKGSEFEKVILIDSNIELSNRDSEEARVRYVAITRPKSKLVAMDKNKVFFGKSSTGRPIQTKRYFCYRTKNIYCESIPVGYSKDISDPSFVQGDFYESLDSQLYIINNVEVFDSLKAVRLPSGKTFSIFHNDHHIGNFSKDMYDEIFYGIHSTDFKYNMPVELSDFYVKAITTQIISEYSDEISNEFQHSKICYGIQVSGMAKLKFN